MIATPGEFPPARRSMVVARWLALIVSVVALVLLLAAIRWELPAAILGAVGPPWWMSLPVVCLGLFAANGALWWRSSAQRTRRVALAVAIAGAIIAVVVPVTHLRAYSTERVTFAGPGIRIAAWVYVPRTAAPHAAVIVIPGSAPFKAGFYDVWADRVVRRGLVVIVPDKRGVGGTGGDFERENNGSLVNLSRLADDVVAAVRYAGTRRDVRADRIGVLGLSQAGWVGPMAAVRSSAIAFMAYITAPTVSGREERIWSDMRGDDAGTALQSREAAERALDTVTAGGVDARPLLGTLTIPGYWLFGTDDNSIPSRRSVQVLDSLARDGHDYTVDTIPGAGHLVMKRVSGSLLPSIAPASWPKLLDWLEARAGS
jgi:uncharacterized protein